MRVIFQYWYCFINIFSNNIIEINTIKLNIPNLIIYSNGNKLSIEFGVIVKYICIIIAIIITIIKYIFLYIGYLNGLPYEYAIATAKTYVFANIIYYVLI